MLASAIEANNSIKEIILDGNPMGKVEGEEAEVLP